MGEHSALLPSQTPFLTLVRFFERCQAKKKPGTARSDLEKLNDAFRATEEGRAELFEIYRLFLPEVLDAIATCAKLPLCSGVRAEPISCLRCVLPWFC